MLLQKDIKKAGLRVIENNIYSICKSVYGGSKRILNEYKMECGLAFNTYINQAIDKYSKCKTLLNRYEPTYLYDTYVNVDVLLGEVRIPTDDICEIIEKGNYILITGTGGIGKTTLMRHLFLNSIYKTQYIPIFIELRDINTLPEDNDIIDLIFINLERLGFGLGKDYIDKALVSGRFILFLDAFDEVEESKRAELKSDIQYLCDKYSENIYIISSREISGGQDFMEWVRFINFKMDILSKNLAVELIKKTKYDNNIKCNFIKDLELNLYNQHKSFASNPLLLIIMLMTYDQYANIPTKIHLFFQQAFETLYSRHDASKDGYRRKLETNLDIVEFENLLSSFSMLGYLRKNRSFNEQVLTSYIKRASEMEKCTVKYSNFKKDLVENLCILVQDGLEYIFTHRTFQEFFTAQYIYRLGDQQQEKIFEYIFETLNSSIKEDILLGMIINMQPDRVEKNFILPCLKKLYSRIDSEDETELLFNYIQYSYGKMGTVFTGEKEEVCFWNLKEGNKYINLLEFIYCKYKEEYIYNFENFNNAGILLDTVKTIGKYSEENNEYEIIFNRLSEEQRQYLIHNGLDEIEWYKKRIIYGKFLMLKLEEKASKTYNVEELINSLDMDINR